MSATPMTFLINVSKSALKDLQERFSGASVDKSFPCFAVLNLERLFLKSKFNYFF